MIGTSVWEYFYIRFYILLFQYTTPICLSCLAVLFLAHGQVALSYHVSKLFIGYAIIDLLYATFIYFPYNQRLREEARHPAPLSSEQRRALFNKCLGNIPDSERYLRLWFLGADESEVRRENVRDFILWAFFDTSPGRESAQDAAEVEQYMDEYERTIRRKLRPGRGKARSLRLTMDAVETRYRSWFWYVCVGFVDMAGHCLLAWYGFQFHAQPRSKTFAVIPPRLHSLFASEQSESPEFSYYSRPHTASDKLPVLFLHGIGIGLITYGPFLSRLSNGVKGDGQIGIIAVELLPVSFRLTNKPLEKLEFLAQIGIILDAQGYDKFVLATHSYGSVLATHMMQSEALGPRIESVVLMDPVTILLHLPEVAYNFTRRKPRRANEFQLWYFASMDPGVAHALGRHFHWKENIIWKEELLGIQTAEQLESHGRLERKQRRVAVCLSERDLIVNTIAVAQYLADGEDWLMSKSRSGSQAGAAVGDRSSCDGYVAKNGIEILWFPGLDHAQLFDGAHNEARACRLIRRYCAK